MLCTNLLHPGKLHCKTYAACELPFCAVPVGPFDMCVCLSLLDLVYAAFWQGKDTGSKAERLLDCWLGTDRPQQAAKLRGCKLAV